MTYLPDRFETRPKYKIGDVVVYRDKKQPEEEMTRIVQSKIVESWGYIDEDEDADILEWYYHTEETLRREYEMLDESDIIYKL